MSIRLFLWNNLWWKKSSFRINGFGNARELRKIFEQGTVEEITEAITTKWERPRDYLDRNKEGKNKKGLEYKEAYLKNLNDRIFRANRLQDVIDKMFIDYPED